MKPRPLAWRPLPDPLPLSTAAVLIAGLAQIRYPGLASMSWTFGILVFVSLLVRWADSGWPRRERPRLLAVLLGAAMGFGAGRALLPPAWEGAALALSSVLAVVIGRPSRTGSGGA